MYMGLSEEASPIARPPKMRHATKLLKVAAKPVPRLDTVKTIAAASNAGLRPKRSERMPEEHRSSEAAEQRAAHSPALHTRRDEAEVRFVERLGTTDDDPVVAEKEAPEGGDTGDPPDIKFAWSHRSQCIG